MSHEVSVDPVDDAYLAGFPSHNDRHGGEEVEHQPVPASHGYKHCRNEHRADSDLTAVIYLEAAQALASVLSSAFCGTSVEVCSAVSAM